MRVKFENPPIRLNAISWLMFKFVFISMTEPRKFYDD